MSQHLREEFIDFAYWLNANYIETLSDYVSEEQVDDYLKSKNSIEEQDKILNERNSVYHSTTLDLEHGKKENKKF